MQRLRLLIGLFFIALLIPLAYFVFSTYQGLEQEEFAELRYFAEALFDTMEQELAAIVLREEARSIDDYTAVSFPTTDAALSGTATAPIQNTTAPYILGYFQNNPDGSLQVPVIEKGKQDATEKPTITEKLEDINIVFNEKRTTTTIFAPSPAPQSTTTPQKVAQKKSRGFADRYLDSSSLRKQKEYLGQESKRVEEITVQQARNLSQMEADSLQDGRQELLAEEEETNLAAYRDDKDRELFFEGAVQDEAIGQGASGPAAASIVSTAAEKLQVEVDPLQSLFIDDDHIFVFRRIIVNDQIFRQGFVLLTHEFLNHLASSYFAHQPISRFTNLRLQAVDQAAPAASIQAGANVERPTFSLDRSFPRPFSFLNATLTCENIPGSVGRTTLNLMIVALVAVVLLGLFAIYNSARTVVDLSERRSQFVSSVTHELKTPLTTIRMYIEMLDQGIAGSREREQDYFNILGAESSRLTRLIDNVLEFSKLEKKQRQVIMKQGTFEDVLAQVEAIMQEKLRQEQFVFTVDERVESPFRYDREVMVQVLINLIENSMKFGKDAQNKKITVHVRSKGDHAIISVSDTGPGIPPEALKKVFHDFYRADNTLTRTTRGTGIGLALVKKFVTALGGTVSAANNDGPGCTITITLPTERKVKGSKSRRVEKSR